MNSKRLATPFNSPENEMELPHASTAIMSAIMAAIAGAILYAHTTKEHQWIAMDFGIAVTFSGLTGMMLSMLICGLGWCAGEDGQALVIGMCGLGGCLGYNPNSVKRYMAALAKILPILKVFVQEEPPPRDPNEPRKSDSDTARTMFGR